jgi:hypothetical protein
MKMSRINRHLLLLFVLRLVTPVLAQVPRPYAFGGLSLNGGGYGATAGTLGWGLALNTTKIIAMAEVAADNAHKNDSDTGHDLFIKARAFYNARNGWYFGGGCNRIGWRRLPIRSEHGALHSEVERTLFAKPFRFAPRLFTCCPEPIT